MAKIASLVLTVMVGLLTCGQRPAGKKTTLGKSPEGGFQLLLFEAITRVAVNHGKNR